MQRNDGLFHIITVHTLKRQLKTYRYLFHITYDVLTNRKKSLTFNTGHTNYRQLTTTTDEYYLQTTDKKLGSTDKIPMDRLHLLPWTASRMDLKDYEIPNRWSAVVICGQGPLWPSQPPSGKASSVSHRWVLFTDKYRLIKTEKKYRQILIINKFDVGTTVLSSELCAKKI